MTFWSIVRQRCWGLLLVVAGVCIITFIISHLIPGDPARLLAGDRASDEIVQNIRQQLGLDQPLYIQFGRYVDALAHGDLGTSIRTGRPVAEDLKAFFPPPGAGLLLPAAGAGHRCAAGDFIGGVPQPLAGSPGAPDGDDRDLHPGILARAGVIVLFYGHLQILPVAAGWTTGSTRPHVTGFICWTPCWKATARSFLTPCNT
jgi:peptide/nickel transport system permease protein